MRQLETLAELLGFGVFEVLVEVYGPRFEDNPAGRVLRNVTQHDPRIGGLLHLCGFGDGL